MANVTQVQNLGLLNRTRQDLLNRYNERLAAGETLTNPEARQYGNIANLQAQKDWTAKNTAYQDALRTRDARAIGGYLGPQSNYDWQKFAQQAGMPETSTQAQYMTPLTAEQYKNMFGYDLSQYGKQFTGADMQAYDPGYQFRINQGLQALDRQAAARGGVLGGGQIKAAQQYAQDLASNEYQNAWARRNQEAQQNAQNYYQAAGYNRTVNQDILNQYQQNLQNYENQRQAYANLLQNRALAGQSASTNAAQMLQSNAQGLSSALMGYGSAQAQNAWNRGAAMNQGIQSGMGALGGMLNDAGGLSGLFGKASGGLAGMFGGSPAGGSTGGLTKSNDPSFGITTDQINRASGLGNYPYGG